MNKILELREKRAKLWEETKAFLDSRRNENELLSAEDTATYEKMEAEVISLGKEIERLERQASIELELSKATSNPIRNNPNTNIEEKTGRATDAYKSAFWGAMRNKVNPTVQNALQTGEDSEGGYLVPDEYEQQLIKALEDVNLMRNLCHVINTSHGDRKIPVVASHGSAAWMDEAGAFEESDDSFTQVSLSAYKLGTMLKISDELLHDAFFNLESYVATEFARRIGAAEEEAFLLGDGSSKPTGLLNSAGGADVGVTAASATAITMDEVIDLYHSLKAPYRKNATFVVNDATIKAIRKLKDGQGNYIWQPSVVAGTSDTILNRPVVTSQYMPTLAAGEKTILFGDLSYYWIADRQGRTFKRLNELYAANGQVGFLAWQRLDGKLILSEAVKVLQQKA
ncbi:Phage major capsid protein [Candidatus Syntrophocurvum alkaliphilum]|uniref:Phage major capsid protein n=1 Tax=Candidatus Syntrophocurvum alkaliphilum TaxID=2293317 RepID=A0A6I6DEB1_9FIRM|nr:phage major capsid protein [Candidatus Syntrophocurvum alkaliphilum]QGT99507.1 Phage major capsid protein [Candidatus Syntrophocurvum alkaliphilum]